jgi:hypothetical protein
MKNPTFALPILSIVVALVTSACVAGGGNDSVVGHEAFSADDGDGAGEVGSHESELLSTCAFRNQIGVFAVDERTACTEAILQADQQCMDQSGLPCCQVSGKVMWRQRGGTWCEYRRYMWTDF